MSRIEVRPLAADDLPAAAALLAQRHGLHRSALPLLSPDFESATEESAAEWESDFDDPSFTTFVAVRDGSVIGSAVGCALSKSSSHTGPAQPGNAGFLGFAAVLPAARGCGAGRALGEAVLAWCGEAGFDSVVTDWRVTNLLSSRAWPALGFQESFLRLHRLIGY